MKTDDQGEVALYFAYQKSVAAIRAYEPELAQLLINPLERLPGVQSVVWRIKPWESVLESYRNLGRYPVEDGTLRMADVLGVRAVVSDSDALGAAEQLVRQSFEIIFGSYGRQVLPTPFDHQEVILQLSPLESRADRTVRRFELQLRTSAAEAFAEVRHLELYDGPAGANILVRGAKDYVPEYGPEPPYTADEVLEGASKADAAVVALTALLDREDVHEKRDVHPFLVAHAYFLHPAIESIVSEPSIGFGTEYRPDFIIREATGEYILVEIENPRQRLFTQRGDFTAPVTHAVQQVEDWQEWFEQNLPTAQRYYPDIVAPRGLVVIGRSGGLNEMERKKLARRNLNTRGSLEILTYDDLISRTRAYVNGIRKHLGA